MDSKIIDTDNLLVNAEECQRLSYDMLFSDNGQSNGNGHAGKNQEKNGSDDIESRKAYRKELELKWKRRLEESREKAFRQGVEEGKKQGGADARESMEQQVETLQRALKETSDRIDSLLDDLKPHMAAMVFDITEQIIGLPIKSESLRKEVAGEIRMILASVEEDVKVRLTVSSADYGFIVRALKDISHAPKIEITRSDSLKCGEYALDTQRERIIKSFNEMLDDFREKLSLENGIKLEVEE